jgi:ATP-dependent DNA ligase
MYDRPMIDDPGDRRAWRPQAFGRRQARHVDDPLVEPLWSGIRVLAHLVGGSVEFVDGEGEARDWPATAEALAASVQADSAVLDGYLTTEAAGDGVGVVAGPDPEVPSAQQMTRQMLLGGGGRNRRAELVDSIEAAAQPVLRPDDDVVFVAVDLLMLDDEALLDVPLLERKRLLDAILVEGPLVRRGIHVRLPIDVWVGTWRSLGFRSIAFKDANSRYRPGTPNDDWATASIPRS